VSRKRKKYERQQKRRNQQAKADQQKARADLPALPQTNEPLIAPDEQPQREVRAESNQSERKDVSPAGPAWYLWVQTFVGIGLLVFTGGQVLVGHWQWDATNKQYDAMLAQNRIAQEQLAQMREDRRAWINVIANAEEIAKGHLAFTFELHNYGSTPART
jgi:hypothetical protein